MEETKTQSVYERYAKNVASPSEFQKQFNVYVPEILRMQQLPFSVAFKRAHLRTIAFMMADARFRLNLIQYGSSIVVTSPMKESFFSIFFDEMPGIRTVRSRDHHQVVMGFEDFATYFRKHEDVGLQYVGPFSRLSMITIGCYKPWNGQSFYYMTFEKLHSSTPIGSAGQSVNDLNYTIEFTDQQLGL